MLTKKQSRESILRLSLVYIPWIVSFVFTTIGCVWGWGISLAVSLVAFYGWLKWFDKL